MNAPFHDQRLTTRRPARRTRILPHLGRWLWRADLLALTLSLLAGVGAFGVAERVFERMPHIEDEIALVWQARLMAKGHLSVASPPHPKHFLVPFVVDYNGQRFGKYPPGWPALLAVGVRLGLRDLVNPLLAALGVWLTYRLGQRTLGTLAGLLAAGLTLISPFFWMNAGSLLSHPFGLVLSAAFVLAWLDAFAGLPGDQGARRRWLATVTAALCLGVLALTRPLTAVGVAAPFAVHGLYLLLRGDAQTRQRLIALAAVSSGLAGLFFVWQWAVTGDPFLNPYTLWWPYDRLGFGPEVGRAAGGHTLRVALLNTDFSLQSGFRDLFGWGPYSWIFLPFGLFAIRRRPAAWLAASVFLSLVGVYMLYWVGSWVYGPRYYFEGFFSLTLLTSAGIVWLAGWPMDPSAPPEEPAKRRRWRPLAVTALVALLAAISLLFYNPIRLGGMRGLHGFNRARLEPFLAAESQGLTPALVIVHPDYWTAYGALLELQDPELTTPFLFTMSRGPEADAALAASFPDRRVFHYYPDEPYVFFQE